MEILDNPFHILRATLRDDRRKIMERAEERSLIEDADHCSRALATLTHPRKRLAAELAWLPGLSPKRTAASIQVLKSDISKVTILESLPPLARSNLYAAALPRVAGSVSVDGLIEWIIGISNACEQIDAESTTNLLNEERSVAGFPEITDVSVVESQLNDQWKLYQDSVKQALDQRESKELVDIVTRAVDQATKEGTQHAPTLLDDIVDRYEIEAHGFLEQEAENVVTVLGAIKTLADSKASETQLDQTMSKLDTVTKNWDRVAQPIQVSKTSRGLEHEMSRDLAHKIRNVAVEIFNENGLLELSQRMTKLQQEVFAEVIGAAQTADDDAARLAEIADQAQEAEASSEEWRQEMFYEGRIGAIFKDTLRISVDGVEWKSGKWSLDEITRTRWGGTQHYTNGVHTGTDYQIVFGNQSSIGAVSTRKKDIYQEFTSRLFRGVCMRLIMEMFQGLSTGQTYRFGTAVVDDFGMELETRKFFGANERKHYSWQELRTGNGGGTFLIGPPEDKKTTLSLSYRDDDNTHILESAIRMLWKKGGSRLSTALQ